MKSKKNIAHFKQNFIADLFNLKEKQKGLKMQQILDGNLGSIICDM